jgi:hypothetical protein
MFNLIGRKFLESCVPDEAVNLAEILDEEKIAEAMVARDLVQVN